VIAQIFLYNNAKDVNTIALKGVPQKPILKKQRNVHSQAMDTVSNIFYFENFEKGYFQGTKTTQNFQIGNCLFTLLKNCKFNKMGGCSVPLCSNRHEKGVKMRRNPKDKNRLTKWHDYLLQHGFHYEIPKNFFICEIHFGERELSDGTFMPEKDPTVPQYIWKQVRSFIFCFR
jgi:hypothetical protein